MVKTSANHLDIIKTVGGEQKVTYGVSLAGIDGFITTEEVSYWTDFHFRNSMNMPSMPMLKLEYCAHYTWIQHPLVM